MSGTTTTPETAKSTLLRTIRQEVPSLVAWARLLLVVLGAIAAVFIAGLLLVFLGDAMTAGAPVVKGFGWLPTLQPTSPVHWAGIAIRWIGALVTLLGPPSMFIYMSLSIFAPTTREQDGVR